MHHLRTIEKKLKETLKTIDANLEIYNQRVREIMNDPNIRPDHKQMNIGIFETHFISVVGMSVADMEKGKKDIDLLFQATQKKIIEKQAAKKGKNRPGEDGQKKK